MILLVKLNILKRISEVTKVEVLWCSIHNGYYE